MICTHFGKYGKKVSVIAGDLSVNGSKKIYECMIKVLYESF